MKKSNPVCFICKAEVLPEDKYFIVALEKPYANLKTHLPCWRAKQGQYPQFIIDEAEFIVKMIAGMNEKK